jgi:hypothetical protein
VRFKFPENAFLEMEHLERAGKIMPETAHKLDQEYWRPPHQIPAPVEPSLDICSECQTELLAGSHFCHMCGRLRALPNHDQEPGGRLHRFKLDTIQNALGLNPAALIALGLGILFVLCAALTGLIYSAGTLVDWQAVQLWRLEWLLAAVAAFVAGILLKRPREM